VSKLPDLIHETKKDFEQVGLVSTVVGHVGDGNFHAMLLFTTDEELEIAQNAAHRIVHRAIAMDGTCLSPFLSLFSLTLDWGLTLGFDFRYGRTWCRDRKEAVS
jgi:FAD linked oxidases, C-terminal domain